MAWTTRKSIRHLKDAGLMMGFADKYYSWSDADVAGAAGFILFQMKQPVESETSYSTVAPMFAYWWFCKKINCVKVTA